MNFYKRFIGDYMRDTAHLSLVEHGAYTVLLDTYYATGKPLPVDLPELYRICRAVTALERKAVDKVADTYFPVSDGFRRNARADIELAKREQKGLVNREIGKLGGRPKQTETVSESDTETVSESKPTNNPNHSHSHKELKNRAFALPDWIPEQAWADYIEMRQKIKKPMTDRAKQLAVIDLAKLKSKGYEPQVVIDNAVKNSWQGLYEPRGIAPVGQPKRVAL